MQCNSPLTSAETNCYSCNSPVKAKNKNEFSDRFRTTVKIFFIISGVVTVASLFVDSLPSFWKCVAAFTVLYLVKNSADNMSEFRKK